MKEVITQHSTHSYQLIAHSGSQRTAHTHSLQLAASSQHTAFSSTHRDTYRRCVWDALRVQQGLARGIVSATYCRKRRQTGWSQFRPLFSQETDVRNDVPCWRSVAKPFYNNVSSHAVNKSFSFCRYSFLTSETAFRISFYLQKYQFSSLSDERSNATQKRIQNMVTWYILLSNNSGNNFLYSLRQ